MNKEFLEELESDIQGAYKQSVTIEEAEKLAAKFLYAQIEIGKELRDADLDSRTHKVGIKASRADVYLNEVGKTEKKPSDTLLEQVVNTDIKVRADQKEFDEIEVNRDLLQVYLSVFKEAHIYFRGIAKGAFNG